MARCNFRHLLYVGRDDSRQSKFSSRIYIVGSRNRTVYIAHGATDLRNRKAYPKWLQHYRVVCETNAIAREFVESVTEDHLNRDFTPLKGKQRAELSFKRGKFEYQKVDGSSGISAVKTKAGTHGGKG